MTARVANSGKAASLREDRLQFIEAEAKMKGRVESIGVHCFASDRLLRSTSAQAAVLDLANPALLLRRRCGRLRRRDWCCRPMDWR